MSYDLSTTSSLPVAKRANQKWTTDELNKVINMFINITSTMTKDNDNDFPFYEQLDSECYNIIADDRKRTVTAIKYKLLVTAYEIINNNKLVIDKVPLYKQFCKAYNKFYTNEALIEEGKFIKDKTPKNTEVYKEQNKQLKRNEHNENIVQELLNIVTHISKVQNSIQKQINLIVKAINVPDSNTDDIDTSPDTVDTIETVTQNNTPIKHNTTSHKSIIQSLEVSGSDSDEEFEEPQQPQQPQQETKKKTISTKTKHVESHDDTSSRPTTTSTRAKRGTISK